MVGAPRQRVCDFLVKPFEQSEQRTAVSAALDWRFDGHRAKSRIELLLENIVPAIESIDPNLPKEERLQAAVEANVRHTMKVLLSTPEAQSSTSGIRLVGALYDIDTGRVSFLD